MALDSGALSGLPVFLRDLLKLDKKLVDEILSKVQVYNLQNAVYKTSLLKTDKDYTLYNEVMTNIKDIQKRVSKGGVHLVIVSSLTVLAGALERAIAGPPSEDSGLGMDQDKWSALARQLSEIRNTLQMDDQHVIWEGHVYKPPVTGQGGQQRLETLQVSGKSAYMYGRDAEQIIRIRRLHGDRYEGTKVHKVFADTQAALDFVPGGRCFTEKLDKEEHDLTLMYYKLGLKIGRWGKKSKK
jgi:hypothetical protein